MSSEIAGRAVPPGRITFQFEGVIGSRLTDILKGRDANEIFVPLGGDDDVNGRAGQDQVSVWYSPQGVEVDLRTDLGFNPYALGEGLTGASADGGCRRVEVQRRHHGQQRGQRLSGLKETTDCTATLDGTGSLVERVVGTLASWTSRSAERS